MEKLPPCFVRRSHSHAALDVVIREGGLADLVLLMYVHFVLSNPQAFMSRTHS